MLSERLGTKYLVQSGSAQRSKRTLQQVIRTKHKVKRRPDAVCGDRRNFDGTTFPVVKMKLELVEDSAQQFVGPREDRQPVILGDFIRRRC